MAMLINATDGEKKLIESGTFNHKFSSSDGSELNFSYAGLKIKLITKVLPESSSTGQVINAKVDNDVVVLTHEQQVHAFAAPSGMLVPMQVGFRNGKKIYFSWLSFLLNINEGGIGASTTYSFYEDI